MSDVADTLAVLQFGDSFFPSGAVSFSWGLEGLFDSGVVTDADAVSAFVIGHYTFECAGCGLRHNRAAKQRCKQHR